MTSPTWLFKKTFPIGDIIQSIALINLKHIRMHTVWLDKVNMAKLVLCPEA